MRCKARSASTFRLRQGTGSRWSLSSDDNMPFENPSGVPGDGFRTFLAPFADGSSASIDPNNTGDNGQVIPIWATVVSAPINTALPAISGPPRRYDTLTATPGLWTGG
jgi:hypothetical protein